jgi:hypothetical protein
MAAKPQETRLSWFHTHILFWKPNVSRTHCRGNAMRNISPAFIVWIAWAHIVKLMALGTKLS